MMRAYGMLLALALACALALSVLGPRSRPSGRPAPPLRETATILLRIVLGDGVVTPATATVPKDHRVHLEVTNRGRTTTSLRLSGYEDRVAFDALRPGEVRSLEFLADRPGDDLAWIVDGNPSGRLVVSGSHLAGDRR